MPVPLKSDFLSIPVLEAMGHGVPVLCSDAGSLPEVAGDAALIFRSGDLEDLMVKMGRLAADETLRKQLAARGAGRVAQFSWEKCATGMMEVFQRVSEEGAQ